MGQSWSLLGNKERYPPFAGLQGRQPLTTPLVMVAAQRHEKKKPESPEMARELQSLGAAGITLVTASIATIGMKILKKEKRKKGCFLPVSAGPLPQGAHFGQKSLQSSKTRRWTPSSFSSRGEGGNFMGSPINKRLGQHLCEMGRGTGQAARPAPPALGWARRVHPWGQCSAGVPGPATRTPNVTLSFEGHDGTRAPWNEVPEWHSHTDTLFSSKG